MTKLLDDKRQAKEWSSSQIGRFLELSKPFAIVVKAAREQAFIRMSHGKTVPGQKLIEGRANRVYKAGADRAAKKKFGSKAMSKPKVLSPAQIEKLPRGSAFAQRWAYKPKGALQVVPSSDKRQEVSKKTKSMFKPVPKKRGKKRG